MVRFPKVPLKGLPQPVFYHCPLLVDTELNNDGPHPFHFENMWLLHRNFREKVKLWWNDNAIQGWADYNFIQQLKSLKIKLESME